MSVSAVCPNTCGAQFSSVPKFVGPKRLLEILHSCGAQRATDDDFFIRQLGEVVGSLPRVPSTTSGTLTATMIATSLAFSCTELLKVSGSLDLSVSGSDASRNSHNWLYGAESSFGKIATMKQYLFAPGQSSGTDATELWLF